LDESGLTEAALEGLVTKGVREGEQLDFKIKPHLPETGPIPETAGGGAAAPWSAQQEWAKDVCQFANHRGGLLLIGVEEEDDVAVGVQPTTGDVAALDQRLRAALTSYSAPPPRIEVITIPAAAGGSYMAIIVPRSELSPHAVTSGPGGSRRTMSFPVRDGSHTRWMSEAELADRYRQRGLTRRA
jgi:predicted HTH transcriptional regulator